MSTLEEQITSLQALIVTVQTNPRPNYRVGDTSMEWGTYLKQLYEIQFELQSRVNQQPVEGWETLDVSVDAWGNDLADYFETS